MENKHLCAKAKEYVWCWCWWWCWWMDGFIVGGRGFWTLLNLPSHVTSMVCQIYPSLHLHTTTDERSYWKPGEDSINRLSFIACVSTLIDQSSLPSDINDFIARGVQSMTDLPLAVGFGISTPQMVQIVANISQWRSRGWWECHPQGAQAAGNTTVEHTDAVRSIVS
jgi:hypothetical protein